MCRAETAAIRAACVICTHFLQRRGRFSVRIRAILQRNAIVAITRDGTIREVAHNDSHGPLEAPTAIVFVGGRAYMNNHDTVAPPNGNGKSSDDGIGAPIAVIDP